MGERSPPGRSGDHRMQNQSAAAHAVVESAAVDPQRVTVDDAIGAVVDPQERGR
jgi:hypothetical protein